MKGLNFFERLDDGDFLVAAVGRAHEHWQLLDSH